ncbi:MAG: hypothetical protein ACJASY_004010 [Halioglobus sp.]|jgi:hypothetical protein
MHLRFYAVVRQKLHIGLLSRLSAPPPSAQKDITTASACHHWHGDAIMTVQQMEHPEGQLCSL